MQVLSIESLTTQERSALQSHETVIERGLQTFNEVGSALLAIRDERLYRADYITFEDYCRNRWQMTRQYANNLIAASEVISNLETMVSILPANERQARPLTELEPEAQRIVWEVVQQTAPDGKITAGHVKSVATVFKEVIQTGAIDDGSGEQIKVADVVKAVVTEETYERQRRQETYIKDKSRREQALNAIHSSESNEWYTPPQYVTVARELMGGIDLDPASSAAANQTVQADFIYTIDDDGLKQDWYGRVWLNPPYGYSEQNNESNQALWSAKLIEAYTAGNVTEAVLLVNAATSTQWFQALWNYPICFTDHRIRFLKPIGEAYSPTTGSALVYFGANVAGFAKAFCVFGAVVTGVIRRDGAA